MPPPTAGSAAQRDPRAVLRCFSACAKSGGTAPQREEAARLAKLSKAEREREAFEKEKAAFEKEKQELQHQKLINQVATELQTEGLPTIFANKLLGETSEATLENIKDFKKIWQEAIQKEVDNRLVTKTPKMGQSKTMGSSSVFDIIKSKKVR